MNLITKTPNNSTNNEQDVVSLGELLSQDIVIKNSTEPYFTGAEVKGIFFSKKIQLLAIVNNPEKFIVHPSVQDEIDETLKKIDECSKVIVKYVYAEDGMKIVTDVICEKRKIDGNISNLN